MVDSSNNSRPQSPQPFRQRWQMLPAIFLAWLAFCSLTLADAGTFDLGESTIQLVDGTELKATIRTIDRNGMVVGTGIPEGLNINEVLSVQTNRKATADNRNLVSLYVTGGGKLLVQRPAMANEQVTFSSAVGISELPLESTRAVVWRISPLVERTLQQPSKENDTVIVETADGDRAVQGILESIDAKSVGLNYQGQSRTIGLAKVRAIVAADLGLANGDGFRATVQLVDQSSLVGLIEELSDDELTLEVGGGRSLRVKTSSVVSFSIASDRLLYLSDMDPVEVQEKSIFAIQRPWQRDQSVAGNQLQIRLAGSEKTVRFNKGLGTQAVSRLVFANTNDFDRFSAVVGIDAETNGHGDCLVVIRGDGIELWSKRIRGTGGPEEVDVDITGLKEVALLVYPGEEFDLGDHVDWGEARFLKTK